MRLLGLTEAMSGCGWHRVMLPLAFMQVPTVERILVKAFGTEIYDVMNGWILMLLLVAMSGAGIFAAVRMVSFKKIINILENDDKPNP